MEDLIEDLQNAFGVRFLYDSARNTMDVIYIKDILKSNEISILDVEIVAMQLKNQKKKRYVLHTVRKMILHSIMMIIPM